MAQPRSYPRIVQDITGCVTDLKKDCHDSQLPITDDSLALHKFCAKLEYLLQIDMKSRSGLLGGRRDYWDYFYKCMYKVKGLNDGLRFVKAMSEVKSSLGRGRAFIRYSLVHHRLGDSLQQCISNNKITSEWYNPSAVVLNAIHGATIINALYDLNDIQFDLAPTGYDLDTAWPTFARKTLGAPSLYLWTPPSRTTSTSSINSQLSTSDSSYPNSPMTDSRPSPLGDQLVHLQKEFEECELVNRQLRQRIDQLEQDNEDIHHMAQETEESMTALKHDSEKQNSDRQEQIIRLEEKLNSKVAELLGMDSKWKASVQDAEKTTSDLYVRIEVLNKQHESREKMLIESEKDLRDKLAMAESSVTELKQQVNNNQLDLATRIASETTAKEKLSDLENKLADAEKRNLDMITRMNDIVQDKDKKVSSHFESASKVHELLARLEGAETEKLELRGVTEELIHKLQLIDTQRTSESESKQRSVSEKEMGQPPEKGSASGDEYPHQIKELENTNKKLISLNAEASKKVENLETAIQKSALEKSAFEKQVIEARRTMSNLEESEWLLTEQIEELQKDIASSEKERDDLTEKVAYLENRNTTFEGGLKKREEDIISLKKENSRLLESMGLAEKELSYMKSACQQLIQNIDQCNTDSHSELVECTDNPQMHTEAYQKSAATPYDNEDIGSHTTLCLSLQSKISAILAGKASIVTQSQREVTILKSHNVEILAQLKEKEEVDNMEVSNLRETIRSLQGQLADAGLRSESQKGLVTEKEKELSGYAEQMNMLRQRVSDLKESVVQKSLELETIQQHLGQSNNRVESLKVALEKSQREKEFLGTSISSTGKAFETLQAEHEQLQKETQELQRYNGELHGESDKLKQINRNMENMIEDSQRLQKENISLEQVFEDRKQKMIKEHEDKVEFLTHQFNTIKDELDNVSADKAELEKQHHEMSVKLKEMQENCELMETERNEIKKTNDELNAEVSRVNESSQLIQSEKEEVAKKLEQLSSEMFQALEENTTRMLRLENELHDTREEKDKEKKWVSELEVEITDTREKLTTAEQKCDVSTAQLSSLQCVMEQEISALKFQLSSEALEYQQNIQGYKHREADQQGLQLRLTEQEENAERIQASLDETRTRLQQQQQKAKEAVEALSEKEVERSVLQEAIQQMSKSMEELQIRNLNSEEELGMLKVSQQGNKTSLEAKLSELQADNVDLKKQLIKLIRDKDTLWQWTDKLDYQRKMKASERWIDDNEVTHCMQCRIEFSLINRRHHCRLCGRIFCTKCASCYVSTAHSRKKSRVCEQCFVVHQHAYEVNQTLTTTLSTPDSDDELSQDTLVTSRSSVGSNTHLHDALESTIDVVSSKEGSSSTDSSISPIKVPIMTPGQAVKEEASLDHKSASLDHESASLDHQTAIEDIVTAPIIKTFTQEEGTGSSDQDVKQIPSSKKVESAQVTGSESSYHSETDQPYNPVIVLDSPLPSRHNLHSDDKDDEPDFDVISEEEVVAARNEPCSLDSPLKVGHVAEASIIVTPTLYTSELEAGVNDDITIKAGQSHAVPIHLDAPGIVLCWEFASAPKTIAFSVTFQPGMELPASSDKAQVDELIPLCKCNSHRHAVQGELMARKAGIYTLLFDNSFSRFTQKTVKYSLQVKRPEAAY